MFTAVMLWAALVLAACAILAAVEEAWEARDRRRRIERLKERRRYLDSLEPKPWVRP